MGMMTLAGMTLGGAILVAIGMAITMMTATTVIGLAMAVARKT